MTRSLGKILSGVLFIIAVLVLVRWFISIGSEEERSFLISLAESLFLVWAGLFFLKRDYIR